MDGSRWTGALIQVQGATQGKADSYIRASHHTRYCLKIRRNHGNNNIRDRHITSF